MVFTFKMYLVIFNDLIPEFLFHFKKIIFLMEVLLY